ncbi:hypothetical protein V8B97DRAFT_1923360 [Scleroderma yunnanense]
MLAGSASISPRPRPPARSRRTFTKSSPPPPYRASPSDDRSVPSESSKPFSESIRPDWSRLVRTAQSDKWDERSRGELSDLLLKADELIKDREQELNVTSAAYKALFENNLELKNRHKAFLARLPTSPALSSPRRSPPHSLASSDVQVPQSPHYYSDASRSSSRASSRASPVPQHQRISVTPSDLVLLSDENAQLLEKLEKLEAESIQADQAGRKKLRILEKEIQGLREELEKTRARSDEFEAKARAASMDVALRSEELSRRRQEREEKIRALRGKSANNSDDSDVRDFAPGNAVAPRGLKLRPQSRRHVSQAIFKASHSEDDVPALSRKGASRNALKRSISQPGLFHIPNGTEPPTEYALVSQLLLKIKELEETNAQIMEHQERTTVQLHSVQKDADNIRLVYESLGNAESVQWTSEAEDSDDASEQEETDETVQFSNLRCSLSETASLVLSDMEASIQSRQAPITDYAPVVSGTRARKSVVGLFDSPAINPATTPSHHSTPSVHSLTIPGLPPVPFVPQPSRTSSRSPSPSQRESMSGTISYGDVSDHPTLDCELGAVFDGAWQRSLGNHHFRTPSLLNFGATGSQLLGPDDLASSSAIGIPSVTEPNDAGSPIEAFTSAFQSSASTGLRACTWHGDRNKIKYETAAERKRRQSATIRMRTNHWNQSRFGGTLRFDNRQSTDLSLPPTPIPQRLAHAFDAVVGTISRSNSENDGPPHELPGDEASARTRDGTADSIRSRSAPVTAPQQHRGIVAFVLEVWLWLQFAIIIVIFVWAMARRGPKSVLEGVGKRKN